MKHRKKAQHDSGLTKICVILGTLTFSSRGSLALYELGRPSCMSFTVFHKFIIICLNHVFLEALIHFHFLSSSLLLISHSIICSARHQMTTRGITYTFYFQSNPFSFFFSKKRTFYNRASALQNKIEKAINENIRRPYWKHRIKPLEINEFLGGSVWRQINAGRRGQTVGWETNRVRAVFVNACHTPLATPECFGSFRLIVSHKLSSAVQTGRPGQGLSLTWLYMSIKEDTFDLSGRRHIKIQPQKLGGIVHS